MAASARGAECRIPDVLTCDLSAVLARASCVDSSPTMMQSTTTILTLAAPHRGREAGTVMCDCEGRLCALGRGSIGVRRGRFAVATVDERPSAAIRESSALAYEQRQRPQLLQEELR